MSFARFSLASVRSENPVSAYLLRFDRKIRRLTYLVLNANSVDIMPKRECPFGDHLSPQLKIHVGQKQVSNGINKEKEMSKVYERTLSMLKNGSKNLEWKSSLSRSESKTNQSLERNSKRYNHKLSSTMKQMIFNSDLKLRATKEAIDLSEEASCINCQTTAMLAYLRCFYCNDFKCRDCAKECSKCEEYFCEKCSLIVYEDGEHTECLACYR